MCVLRCHIKSVYSSHIAHGAQETLRFKNKVSPYIGKRLTGRVEKTYLGGALVWEHGAGAGDAARGGFV